MLICLCLGLCVPLVIAFALSVVLAPILPIVVVVGYFLYKMFKGRISGSGAGSGTGLLDNFTKMMPCSPTTFLKGASSCTPGSCPLIPQK